MLTPGMMSRALSYSPARTHHPVEPASREVFVRSTQVGNGDPDWLQKQTVFPTVAAALRHCRGSGYVDVVNVLPGHAESLATADAWADLVAGTRIVGWGRGNTRPTFTWTAAGSTLLFNVANCSLENVICNLAGSPSSSTALTVAAPITVSAEGCGIYGCRMNWGVDADQIVTIGITTTAAADDFEFIGNRCYGNSAAEATTFLRLVGADRCRIIDSIIDGATSSVNVGVVQMLTTASLNIEVDNSIFYNRKASSVHAFTGMAAATGTVKDSGFGILNDSLLVGLVTPGDLVGFNNRTVNLAGEQGGNTTPIST